MRVERIIWGDNQRNRKSPLPLLKGKKGGQVEEKST